MHLFKKLMYATGRQQYYCMNYYIDESHLALDDRNIYTATEIVTLIPAGGAAIGRFFLANEWVGGWVADFNVRAYTVPQAGAGRFQSLFEWIFNNRAGDKLDDYLMRVTTRRWQAKKNKRRKNEDGQEMELITDKHYARSNPGRLQKKILSGYSSILEELSRDYPRYF